MVASAFQGRKGAITDIVIRYYKEDGTLDKPVVVSTPTDATLNKGISLTEIMASTPLGEMALVDQFTNESKPAINFTFPFFNPQTVGMREGLKPTTEADPTATWVAWGPRQVTKQEYAAATTGQEGFGVTANPTGSMGSVLNDDGTTTDLTISGTYTPGTPPTGPNTLSIGANFGLAFSSDLVGKYVTLYVPNSLAGIVYLSEASPQERCEIRISGVTRQLGIWNLKLYEAILNPAEGDISLAAEQQIALTYTVLGGGRCRPYEWAWVPQTRACQG